MPPDPVPPSRLCAACASPLVESCPSCRDSSSGGGPGGATEESARLLTGERRVVTVLFADISGFTSLSERMDPEEVRGLMNSCFDLLVPIVEKYGGVVDKFLGDGVMALFGAPLAHEDDPVRALGATLEMLRAVQRLELPGGQRLDLHAAINTGLVVSGGDRLAWAPAVFRDGRHGEPGRAAGGRLAGG